MRFMPNVWNSSAVGCKFSKSSRIELNCHKQSFPMYKLLNRTYIRAWFQDGESEIALAQEYLLESNEIG